MSTWNHTTVQSTFVKDLRRTLRLSSAFVTIMPKVFLAYGMWFWAEICMQLFTMLVFVYFWKAIYSNSGQASISGLTLAQTLGYMLLTRILGPSLESRMIFNFGYAIREGLIAVELLRPVDYQGRSYIEQFAMTGMNLLTKLPLILVAVLFFGLRLPSDPMVWGAFAVSFFLAHAVSFCFDWLFASLAFYSTETWGLGVVREAVSLLFSGALLPLVMLPGWLQAVTNVLPFSKIIYIPVALLSGILPPAEAPVLWLEQALWLVGLLVASRWFFNYSVRKITVQGG